MANNALVFSQSALGAIQSLRIQVELNENISLRCRTPNELLTLVETAISSSAPAVVEALKKVLANLTPQQLSELKESGIKLFAEPETKVAEKSYRGVKVQTEVKQASNQDDGQKPHTGKRKIIYRGQVQWV